VVYRLNAKGELEIGVPGPNHPIEALQFLDWDKVAPPAKLTNRQMAALAHIKAALETAETSQL
jgi:hypothetical protein